MTKSPSSCPEWELAICRVTPPLSLGALTVAHCFGAQIDWVIFGLVVAANWNQSVATLGLPRTWIVRLPTLSVPTTGETKQIEDKVA